MVRTVLAAAGALLLAITPAPPAAAAPMDRPEILDEVVVVAPYGATLEQGRVSGNVQTATSADAERAQSLDLTDFLNRHFGSVHVNHAQSNPLQPDLNFRGFTASPLLGLPQGLAVYQDGVRINEPFGDTVNWDLIALSAIDSMQLLAGSNPLFGLNSLGGALTLQTKNGFSHSGFNGEAYGGSFDRYAASAQFGGNNGKLGYYLNADYFEEAGWRDDSASDALRLFGAFGYRGAGSSADITVAHAQTNLRGNGSAPVELLRIDRAAVFTHPDITENSLSQISFSGSMESGNFKLAGHAFYRALNTDTFNGDATNFEKCQLIDGEFLVEDEFTDTNGDGQCNAADDSDIEPVLDQDGNRIAAEVGGAEQNAVNNIGEREQESYGASVQTTFQAPIGGRRNDLLLGAAVSRGDTSFESEVEVAQLLADRSTSRTGLFAEEFATEVDSRVVMSSAYFADTLDITDAFSLSVSGRYDMTRVELRDRSGESPELNGSHKFARFNPALSATYRVTPAVITYAMVSESSRAPTAVELACASEDAPCSLPNAFLADPPLEQVVAQSIEIGARGALGELRWHLGAFHTVNRDDILFQTTGGPQANIGFFDNVGDTRRMGLELKVSQSIGALDWSLQYSLIDATFEDEFIVNSPHHPALEEVDPAVVGAGKLQVASGAAIPGIPQHQANLGADYAFGKRLRLGGDVEFRSGIYLRGDEPNALEKTGSYATINLHAEFDLSAAVQLFARIENLFDTEYETFGVLGEPDEVFPEFSDPRFLGVGPPFGAWVGVRMRL